MEMKKPNLHNAEFLRSAVKESDFPHDPLPQIVFAGDPLGVVQRDAREIGHGPPRSVAGAGLHQQVGCDGHCEDQGGDQREVPEQRVLPDPGEVIGTFLHESGVISAPSGRGRRQ